MYLRRKIDEWLINWKNNKDKMPALIVGIRQCGKTESIKNFGKNNYENVIYLNFWDEPDLVNIFAENITIDYLISKISIKFPNQRIISGKTLFIFDEIQECPRARLSLKSFGVDGRFDVIASGSYLGINGYVIGDSTPVHIGYEDIFHMKTMDFEEFLWAKGYKDDHITIIENYFNNREKVNLSTHNLFKNLFNEYLCVGGFPKAVVKYINSNNFVETYKVNKNILSQTKNEFGRRKGKHGKPVFRASEVEKINSVFDLMSSFLSNEAKRFIVSKIEKGNVESRNNAINYLKEAHIVGKVYNLENPSLPLKGNMILSQFKLFPTDISLLISAYDLNTIDAILNQTLGQNKGALYEAAVFDALYKADFDVFYFAKESGLEIDFVICYNNSSCLVEAKAKSGNTKSSKTVHAHPEHYGKVKIIKVGDYNIGETEDILTIPYYMLFLLGRQKEMYSKNLSMNEEIDKIIKNKE